MKNLAANQEYDFCADFAHISRKEKGLSAKLAHLLVTAGIARIDGRSMSDSFDNFDSFFEMNSLPNRVPTGRPKIARGATPGSKYFPAQALKERDNLKSMSPIQG